ncbi:MAG TPA: phosphoribosyltransferase family protein [Gemmatimonadaceae bacterium]|nr:phosphoribosyltransferase family protein [Gemmatimonadaceae bacterium]
MAPKPFSDRRAAGKALAAALAGYANRSDVVVLGLARGGVPVAAEVARALGAPLDVFVVRKLGVPGFDELALGAIASGGVRVLNQPMIHELGITTQALEEIATTEGEELERRERAYRGGRPMVDVAGRTIVLVDDGLATGASMFAAIEALRQRRVGSIVAAAPVASREAVFALRGRADEVVSVMTPEPFRAVGLWYDDFTQTSDEEVRALLSRNSTTGGNGVVIPCGDQVMRANLAVPAATRGIVIFAHGSGSSRLSPRNRFVARALNQAGFATLLLDLLTRQEEAEDDRTGRLRFDIILLATRLECATRWVMEQPALESLPVAYFGASTGAAAAIVAASHLPDVCAVVSRGGRPDLAGPALARLRAPTRFIVGGLDTPIIELTDDAQRQITARTDVRVVAGATHLFEEPGALDEVARLASEWFRRWMPGERAEHGGLSLNGERRRSAWTPRPWAFPRAI